MIKIKDKKWLAQGANRVCYVHPDDPNKLLKIIKPEKRAKVKKSQAPWYKKMRSSVCFDDNLQELKAFKRLEKKEGVENYFPKCFGVVETDLGEAICVECIHSGLEGRNILSLQNYLREYGFTNEIMKALDELCCFLYDNLIVTRDLRMFNIMVRHKNEMINLVIVDGLGNSEFIPISDFIASFARTKMQRKFKRFKQRMDRIGGNVPWKIPTFRK